MRILFISSNPFGIMGTSGTYNLAESFAKDSDFYLICNGAKHLKELTVCKKSKNYETFELSSFDFNSISNIITKKKIQICIFSISNLWVSIIEQLKNKHPKCKFVLDIKTPWLKNKNATQQFRKKAKAKQKFIDLIITPAESNIKTWIDNPNRDVITYPLGINLDDYINQKFENKSSCKKFVYIGQIHEKRKIFSLLESINRLPKNIKNNCVFDFYGQGPLFKKMVGAIKNKELTNIVNMKGIVSSKQLAKILPEYDCGIAWVPNDIYSDSPSLKLIEYMAAGIYPIATNTNAHKKFNANFKFDLFEESKSDFRKTITNLYNNGIKKEDLIHNFENVKNFDFDCICKKTLIPSFKCLLMNKKVIIHGPRLRNLYDGLRGPEIQMNYKKKYLPKWVLYDKKVIADWNHSLFINEKTNHSFKKYSVGPNLDFNYKKLKQKILNKFIVADSEWMKQKLIKDYDIPPLKIDVIPVYVGENFYKCEYEPNEEFTVGLIGYIDKNDTKNIKSLLKICTKTPEIQYQLLSSRKLKEFSKDILNLKNLKIIKAERNQIVNIMKKWNCFLGVSKCERGPASLQESKTIGIPSICPNHTGYSEFNPTIKLDIEPFKEYTNSDIELIINAIYDIKHNFDVHFKQEQENRKWFWHTEKKPEIITKKWLKFFDKCIGE